MPVQDLYYKKYLKYKNKYLELKQYGGGPLEEAKARIEDRVREDEEGSKLINACKEFFVWPTSKVAIQRKEDDEYVAKNDKSVTVDYEQREINEYFDGIAINIEKEKKRLEETYKTIAEMQEIDSKVLNVTGPPFYTYVKNIININNFNPNKSHTVRFKIISTGIEESYKFNNYLKAVQYVRDNFDSLTNYESVDHTKWIIIDDTTNTIINYDFYYNERNDGNTDTDDFYKVEFLHKKDDSDSDRSDSD
jgi:hypothetical protein